MNLCRGDTKSAAITPLLNKPQRHKGHEEEEEEDKRGCRAGFGMKPIFHTLKGHTIDFREQGLNLLLV
ncbi:MAG TPA: hypothetical protein DC064_06050 [Cyanobacteria bacterium UBA9273]|nr:hypothetical protein [Cyanobacteria bacterium UBA9273]